MIVDLPNTTTSKVAKKVMNLRETGGVVALSRVLTLVVVTQSGFEEEAIAAANLASREHPCRIIVVVEGATGAPTSLSAQIRVGGDAGASEVIVLHADGELATANESLVNALLLPDAPIVAWWPHGMPESASETAIGKIAHRRITDSRTADEPQKALFALAKTHVAGDTDLAWTRLTLWRAQLAAVLDQLDAGQLTAATVKGSSSSPSVLLLAAARLVIRGTHPASFVVHGACAPSRGRRAAPSCDSAPPQATVQHRLDQAVASPGRGVSHRPPDRRYPPRVVARIPPRRCRRRRGTSQYSEHP